MPRLAVKYKGKNLRTLQLGENIITIGRCGISHADFPDIILPDKSNKISRYHAALIQDQEHRFFIRDLASANGTRINGKSVNRKYLGHGDIIRIGDYDLVYQDQPEHQGQEDRSSLKSITLNINHSFVLPSHPQEKTVPNISLRDSTHCLPAELRRSYSDVIMRLDALTGTEELSRELIRLLASILKAHRGLIASIDSTHRPRALATFGAERSTDQDFAIAPKTFKSVVEKNEYALSEFGMKSALCWRLWLREDSVGIAYIEKSSGPPFSTSDIDFVKAVTGQLGPRIIGAATVEEHSTHCEPTAEKVSWKSRVIGNSEVIRKIRKEISIYAKSDLNILLLGDTGTGKGAFAEFIHQQSPRNARPFVVAELSKIDYGHIEGDLFGWKKGAFTDAKYDRQGFFERAEGGTLFLDEIGDIDLEVQKKIRRAVEEKIIEVKGSNKFTKVDVRLVSATNVDLRQQMSEGKFKTDLFARLGKTVTLPPLKNHPEDIPLLVHYFIDQHGGPPKVITNSVMKELLLYEWPNNVREVKEFVDEFMACESQILFPWDLPAKIKGVALDKSKNRPKSIKEMEKEAIIDALRMTNGHIADATKILGYRSEQTTRDKIKKYHIPWKKKRGGTENFS